MKARRLMKKKPPRFGAYSSRYYRCPVIRHSAATVTISQILERGQVIGLDGAIVKTRGIDIKKV